MALEFMAAISTDRPSPKEGLLHWADEEIWLAAPSPWPALCSATQTLLPSGLHTRYFWARTLFPESPQGRCLSPFSSYPPHTHHCQAQLLFYSASFVVVVLVALTKIKLSCVFTG